MKLPKRVFSEIVLFVVVLAGMFLYGARSEGREELTHEFLPHGRDGMNSTDLVTISGEGLESLPEVTQFYTMRAHRLAWSKNGMPLPQADSLITAIQDAYREGLEPQDYHLIELEVASAVARRTVNEGSVHRSLRISEMDCLFTDAFLKYASHLLAGRTTSQEELKDHNAGNRRMDVVMLADSAVEKNCVLSSLQQLLPVQGDYRRLRNALAAYRQMAQGGGWINIPTGLTFGPGAIDVRVQMVRDRLAAEGRPMQIVPAQSDTFDGDLRSAVKKFQQLHGLNPDGIVDGTTRASLNVPVEQRIRQIEINMERWRLLKYRPSERCIIVNIANFGLQVIEKDSAVLSMRVIVGKSSMPTPVLASVMTHVILNPAWNVPDEIALNEIMPSIARNAHYLAQRHFRVYRLEHGVERELDPATIDSTTQHVETVRFQQQPGPLNALGRLKFLFQNKFSVYIHGTLAQSLFKRNVREFSHGCIRIEHPLDLAEYLLRDDSSWTAKRLAAAIKKGDNYPVRLLKPIPVYLLYLTAWMENSGNIQFRDDIYDLDNAPSTEIVGELKVTKESQTVAGTEQRRSIE